MLYRGLIGLRVSQIWRYHFGGPNSKDYNMLVPILAISHELTYLGQLSIPFYFKCPMSRTYPQLIFCFNMVPRITPLSCLDYSSHEHAVWLFGLGLRGLGLGFRTLYKV